MVMSMTGYGIDTFHLDDVTITIEIRSINSRYLDIISKLPRSLFEIELEMKKIIQTYIHRGRIEIYISTSGSQIEERSLVVDWNLMDEFFEQIRQVQTRYHLHGEIPVSIVTAMEDLFQVQENKRSDKSLQQNILASMKRATKQVVASRKSEGIFLKRDMLYRLAEIEKVVSQISSKEQTIYTQYHERIKQRIEKHIGEMIDIEQSQLLKEIAILAEKSDITEEIVRLHSHLEHFKLEIEQAGPVGRKLDFIIQEMNRETNTIGAKSVDPSISEWVVGIKSNLEKIKEQIQNIE